jgi:hypothetical protein
MKKNVLLSVLEKGIVKNFMIMEQEQLLKRIEIKTAILVDKPMIKSAVIFRNYLMMN